MPPNGENLLLLADAALRGRRVHAVYVTSEATVLADRLHAA
jgi:hypothetical protein